MTDFKVGDVVRLKSGGPKMTIGASMKDDRVECHWFGGQTIEVNHAAFHKAGLVADTAETT
jgi:uncharacterized protein YodC (DUF2158 family)